MMTIPKALSSGQAQTYHKLEYTSAAQSYYKQGDEVKGEWQGRLATSLGLSGEVTPQEFSRLSEGQHPQTEVQMVRHREAVEYLTTSGKTVKAVEHRAGWDATFSAPKSVSLTALVGGDDRVREAHAAAVTVALNELEKYTHARIGGNNPAEHTGKFIAAKFEHDTARPVDGYAAPQLHTHAVIFNVTERADGSTRALQERPFFESKQFATAVYQSELMYRLRDLGYEIEPGKSGAPEVEGYSQAYLDASSLRSQQIRDEMERSGVSGPRAAQIAAHSTRDKKQTLTRKEVLEAHRSVAAEFGNQPRQVILEARERAQTQERNPDRATRAKEAITYARDSLFEREAVADERLILRDALRRGMGETTYAEVRADFEARRQRGDLRSVETAKYASGRSFTTPETIVAERANIAYVVAGRNAVTPIMSAELAQDQASSRDFLNDTQRRVIEEVLNSTDRIHGLQGRAGSGKTTVLASIREGAEKSGYTVEGFAPTSRASAQLREVGIDATTLQSFLARGDNHPSASPDLQHLYMLDESSLASTRQMRSFLDKLNPNDRVLVIGDTSQHQGVDAGKPFEQMQGAGMRTSQLDRIMRQKDPELLKAVEELAKNNTQQGIGMLASQGRITEIPNRQERITAIARDYAAQPENTIVVSPDNRSRQQINEAVRAELLAANVLAPDGQIFRTLNCYAAKVSAHVAQTVAAKPELVQISTAYGGQKEGSPVLPRNKYTAIRDGKPKSKDDAKRPEFKVCKFTTEAIITEGSDVGTIHKVCANPTCPVHHPEQSTSRNDEKWKAEQEKRRKEQAIANTTGLRILSAVSAAVPVRLLKRDLLFILEKLISIMDENRVEMLARQHGIRQKRDDGGVGKTLTAFIRRADEGTLSRLLVEASILLAASRGNPSTVLKEAATAYEVDIEAITAKVKQEFAAKKTAKKASKPIAKKTKKAA